MELLKKAKGMKPSQLKEMQQVQMLLQLKKMKQLKELEKKIELEQDGQWKQFEELNKEMGDKLEMEKMKLKGKKDKILKKSISFASSNSPSDVWYLTRNNSFFNFGHSDVSHK